MPTTLADYERRTGLCLSDTKQLISHRFMLGDVMSAYDTFGHAAREQALKVILTND